MRRSNFLAAALLILVLFLAIPACGRKGDPKPPEKISGSSGIQASDGWHLFEELTERGT